MDINVWREPGDINNIFAFKDMAGPGINNISADDLGILAEKEDMEANDDLYNMGAKDTDRTESMPRDALMQKDTEEAGKKEEKMGKVKNSQMAARKGALID